METKRVVVYMKITNLYLLLWNLFSNPGKFIIQLILERFLSITFWFQIAK